jgi:hypothetical protein
MIDYRSDEYRAYRRARDKRQREEWDFRKIDAKRNTTEAARERKRRWASANRYPVKESARRELRNALKRGDILRPEKCETCGTKAVRSDGVTAIQGHHHNYSKPLNVEWLCPSCHREVHDAAQSGGKE